MSHAHVIQTHRRMPALLAPLFSLVQLVALGAVLGLGIVMGGLSVAYLFGVDPAAELRRAHEAGRAAATAEAMDSIGAVVGDAYANGYRTGQAATCQRGAPL
jgi:hypothetical protein